MASTAAETETSPLLPAIATPAPSALSQVPSNATGSSTGSEHRPKPPRSVTFNPNPVTKTIDPEPSYQRPRTSHHHHHAPPSPTSPSAVSFGGMGGGPMAALNSKLRRRNSHGSVPTSGALATGASMVGIGATSSAPAGPKIGPQRSSKTAQKLKLLPNPEIGEEGTEDGGGDEESGRDVYSQLTRIKDPTARRDAKRLGKADRDRLPRVTAYCTANKYQMEGLMRFLKGRGRGSRGANPKLIDECIYTPYNYGSKQAEVASLREQLHKQQEQRQQQLKERLVSSDSNERRHSTGGLTETNKSEQYPDHDDLIDVSNEGASSEIGNGFLHHGDSNMAAHGTGDDSAIVDDHDFDTHVHTPEVFLFEYGVVVIWGMTASQEQRFLKEIAKFEMEKLAPDDVEAEYFNFYYTREYQARIYNDFITLRDKNNYMTKLAISHALAQSVKTSLFEELIASTIDTCKDIPTQIALTGKIALSRTQINMQIGELFILRINIHLNGSVLDTPELFWVEPQLEPVYQAVRSYLEMDQRVGLLTERLDVIADLLAVLKDQLSHGHGEKLEWIVIILIAAEILVAAVNIVVDLYAGID